MTDQFDKLVLKNFLSWKKGVFNFHPGVNVLIGESDGGKSAMMDAFYKLFYNRPMGTAFQSHWGGETLISLTTSGKKIRYRKDKLASYEIKDIATGKVTLFDAPKTTVPEQITTLLNMNRKINVQKQLEKKAPIFLLSESPGDISKHLNEVARLENIDISLDIGKKAVKAGETAQKAVDLQIHTKTKELEKYEPLDKINMLITHAEKIQKKDDLDNAQQSRLTASLDEYTQVRGKLKKLRKKLAVVPLIEEASRLQQKIIKHNNAIKSFGDHLNDIEFYQNTLKEIQDKKELAPYVRRCSNLLLIIAEYTILIETLVETKDQIQDAQLNIKETKLAIKKGRKRLKKEFPLNCPWCHQIVKKDLL